MTARGRKSSVNPRSTTVRSIRNSGNYSSSRSLWPLLVGLSGLTVPFWFVAVLSLISYPQISS